METIVISAMFLVLGLRIGFTLGAMYAIRRMEKTGRLRDDDRDDTDDFHD